jgi:drug/metabolite transporter (DMT)-like permease
LWWFSLLDLFIEFTFNELKPTTVAVFIYLQPFATVLPLVWQRRIDGKVVSAILIFSGVYFVTAPNKC